MRGSETSEHFCFIDNNELTKYSQGGGVGEKFNDIKKEPFQRSLWY